MQNALSNLFNLPNLIISIYHHNLRAKMILLLLDIMNIFLIEAKRLCIWYFRSVYMADCMLTPNTRTAASSTPLIVVKGAHNGVLCVHQTVVPLVVPVTSPWCGIATLAVRSCYQITTPLSQGFQLLHTDPATDIPHWTSRNVIQRPKHLETQH